LTRFGLTIIIYFGSSRYTSPPNLLLVTFVGELSYWTNEFIYYF